jgi:BlaI family penicillinase repressor
LLRCHDMAQAMPGTSRSAMRKPNQIEAGRTIDSILVPKLQLGNEGLDAIAGKDLTFDGNRRKLDGDGGCRNVDSCKLERTRMAKEIPSLGELEIRVLRLVWQQQPCTERQITDMIQQERSLGRTTVLKTIQRLEAKGLLARLPGEGPVHFRASIQEHKVLPALIGRFVEGVLGGSAEPLVAYLAGTEKLSAKDLETLRTICRKIDKDSEKP